MIKYISLDTALDSVEQVYNDIIEKYNIDKMMDFIPMQQPSFMTQQIVEEYPEEYDEEDSEIIEVNHDEPQAFAVLSDATTHNQPLTNLNSTVDMRLLSLDIEDLLKQEGITHIGKKAIKFGRRGLRPKNANYGSKNSWHYVLDQYTGNASARDISIPNGTDADYAEFRRMLLSNERVRNWMTTKGWGIINELTPAALKKTKGTGRHFHFGPDRWAKRTWNTWLQNPNISVTKIV